MSRSGTRLVGRCHSDWLLPLLAATVVAGCSKGPPPAAVVTIPDASGPGVDASTGFTIQALGCGRAGTQSAIAVSGTKVGVVSLAHTSMTQTCTIMPLGPVMMSQVPIWDVCYASSNPDGTYTSKIITSQPYTGPTGVALAFDSKGDAAVAFTGVGAPPAAEKWCGANDLFVTRAQAGTFGMPVQVSNGSTTGGLVAAQAGNCTQNVCGSGDTTGLWPAIGFDPFDTPMVAYRDVHFGFAMDDVAKSDVEFAEGTGSGYTTLTVDVSRGGGTYSRIAFTPAGLPSVLQFDETGTTPGVYVDTQLMAGSVATQLAVGGWGANQVSIGPIADQLGFGINAQGLFAAAYYDMGMSRLLYSESKDGITWSAGTSIDTNGSTGFYPSLAFDSSGEPGIAYYRCNSHAGTGMKCDPMQDGLYLARRTGTTWNVQLVADDPNVTDGLYPALAFLKDKAVIAYQNTSFDPVAMAASATWWVAEEQ